MYFAKATKKSSSIYGKVSFLCKLACITGSFPVKGVLSSKPLADLCMKKLSLLFILSCSLGTILKFLCFILVSEPAGSSTGENLDNFSNSSSSNSSHSGEAYLTDIAATSIGFLMLDGFGLATHFLCLSKSNQFITLLNLLETYSKNYSFKTFVNLYNPWTIGSISCSLFSLLYKTYWAILVYTKILMGQARGLVTFTVFLGGYRPPLSGFIAIYVSVFVIFEYNVVFFYIQILFTSYVITKMMSDLIEDIEQKGNSDNDILDNVNAVIKLKGGIAWTITGNNDELGNSFTVKSFKTKSNNWMELGHRYVEIEKMFQMFEKFASPYLITSFAYSVGIAVCIGYLSTTGSVEWPSPLLSLCIVQGTCSISTFRINALTDIGEKFRGKHAKILKSSAIVAAGIEKTVHEKEELNDFVRLVEAMPLKLSAGGYFTVCRKNVTSIISVIITYIIVLQQFRMSENQQQS